VIVVFDEAYYEYAVDEDYPDTIKYVREGRNVVVLRSFSKIYGLAGLRVGYGVAKPEIVEYLNRVRPPFNVNTIAQAAALAALADSEHVERSRYVNDEGKAFLERELGNLGVEYVPTRANFIFLDFKRDAGPICNALLKEGVIIRSMTAFGLSANFARVTIGTREQNEFFIEKLAKVLKNYGRGDG